MLTDKHYMDIAKIIASASYCERKKVGAVLVNQKGHIIDTGYNGNPSGTNNVCEVNNVTKDTVIHAELNCILNATTNDLAETTIYTTLSPCLRCAALIKQKGINKVIYQEKYEGKNDGTGWLFIDDVKIQQL